ncbi:RAI1 like PD-XK nuclease-domain-containing protein [Dipodascopsis uninucleata]
MANRRPDFHGNKWINNIPVPEPAMTLANGQPQFSLPISTARIKSAAMKQPREITSFSFSETREFKYDDSSMAYLYFQEEEITGSSSSSMGGVNLSNGFTTFQKRDDSIDEHLDGLLWALMRLEKDTGKKVTADFVMWRGLVRNLLCVPYSRDDGFELNATYFDGQIFIEENKEYKLNTQRPLDQRGELMSYWGIYSVFLNRRNRKYFLLLIYFVIGYKFEQVTTIPKKWCECTRDEIVKRGDGPVNNNTQYCSVVKTGLGDIRVVIAGEVDCVADYKPNPKEFELSDIFDNPLDHYVELKTNRVIQSDRDAVKFESKLYKTWAQCFLLGVPRCIVGFRDDQGYLQMVEEFRTQNIPAIVKKSKFANRHTSWDGVDSIAFLAACFQWLKAMIPRSDDHTVWRIRYIPRSDYLLLFKTEKKTFLRPEFITWRLESQLN